MVVIVVDSVHHCQHCPEVCEVDWLAVPVLVCVLWGVAEDAVLLNVGFKDELLCLLDVFLEVVLVPKEKV